MVPQTCVHNTAVCGTRSPVLIPTQAPVIHPCHNPGPHPWSQFWSESLSLPWFQVLVCPVVPWFCYAAVLVYIGTHACVNLQCSFRETWKKNTSLLYVRVSPPVAMGWLGSACVVAVAAD